VNPKLDFIFKRRSIRKFTEEAVSEADLQDLLEAAMAAPTAVNSQPWHFVVVRDEAQLQALRKALPFGKMQAPLAISVCGVMGKLNHLVAEKFWMQDCSAATENILLAATALGLGSVWCGVSPSFAMVKSISEVLGLPKQVIPLNVIFIGHPAESREAGTKYSAKKVSYERYRQTEPE